MDDSLKQMLGLLLGMNTSVQSTNDAVHRMNTSVQSTNHAVHGIGSTVQNSYEILQVR